MTLSICTGIRLVAIALLAAASAAWAQPAPASPDAQISPNDVPVGDTTRALLAIQRNGSQAGKMLPLSGEQAALGYGRYMQSFQHPLPAFLPVRPAAARCAAVRAASRWADSPTASNASESGRSCVATPSLVTRASGAVPSP